MSALAIILTAVMVVPADMVEVTWTTVETTTTPFAPLDVELEFAAGGGI